jgi:chaperonin GroEL
MITVDHLGEVEYATTDNKNTVITLGNTTSEVKERIEEVKTKMKDEKDGFIKKKLEQRLAMLSGSVGIVKVGAGSKVELKEKKDRAEDAIYATKAALKEGIVPGGGVALLNASQKISPEGVGEEILLEAITAPFRIILQNAGLEQTGPRPEKGLGVDVTTGKSVNMIESGIIDPVLVTKSALKNAVSVVSTIISADCVISNVRANEGS